MNCNMGRRSSGGRHGPGLNMLVSESARVGPDIIVWLIATLGSSDRGGYGMSRMMPVVQTYQCDYDSR
jgi:hypothetical protein